MGIALRWQWTTPTSQTPSPVRCPTLWAAPMSALWLMSSVSLTEGKHCTRCGLCFQILKVEQLFKKSLLLILTGHLHCFPSSWPQTAVGAEAHDSGYRHGCSLHLCVDWKPSSDPGLDQARLQCGKATTTEEKASHQHIFLMLKLQHHTSAPFLRRETFTHGLEAWIPHTFSHTSFFQAETSTPPLTTLPEG